MCFYWCLCYELSLFFSSISILASTHLSLYTSRYHTCSTYASSNGAVHTALVDYLCRRDGLKWINELYDSVLIETISLHFSICKISRSSFENVSILQLSIMSFTRAIIGTLILDTAS